MRYVDQEPSFFFFLGSSRVCSLPHAIHKLSIFDLSGDDGQGRRFIIKGLPCGRLLCKRLNGSPWVVVDDGPRATSSVFAELRFGFEVGSKLWAHQPH